MKNALEIRNLSKAYTDFTLDNINLTHCHRAVLWDL